MVEVTLYSIEQPFSQELKLPSKVFVGLAMTEHLAPAGGTDWTRREVSAPCLHQSLYRGTSLIRKRLPLGPYRRPMPRALWWS